MRLLDRNELAMWQTIPAAVLSDERGHRGVLSGLRPLFPGLNFAAQAITIAVGASENRAAREALAMAWPQACIVIDARSARDAAVWGGKLAAIARDRGVAAIVVDGNVRDVVDLRTSGLAVYSRGVTPRGPMWGGTIGGIIDCGGVSIAQGDLIVGDEDGLIAVPIGEVTSELLGRCNERLAREAQGNPK
jgi:regulator of RNase E activity RraA